MYDEVYKMKKFIFIILFIFSMQLFPAAVTKYYDKWKVRTITYDNTDAKTVTISLEVDKNLEIYIASRTNQFNITLTWYKDNIDEDNPIVQYKFNDSQYYSVEPIMRSSKDNFDIHELLREEALLLVPEKRLCRQDCKGICQGCGAALNYEKCTCKKAVDDRWAALDKLK